MFQYQPYRSPFANSIADTLLRRGDIAAQQAERIGNAQATAALQRGQAWAGAAQGIGQIPQQIAQAQAQQQEQQIRGLQLQSARRQQADVTALDQAYQNGVDRNAIIDALPGHLKPVVQKQFAEADEALLKTQKLKDETAVAERDYFGSLAAGVKPFLSEPDGGVSAAMVALQHAKQAGYGQADQLWSQIKANPQALPQLVDQLIQSSPKQVELQAQKQTAEARTLTAQTGAQKFEAEKPKLALETQAAQQKVTGTEPIQPAQQATIAQGNQRLAVEAANSRLKAIEVGLAQKKNAREQAQFDALYTTPEDGSLPENPVAKGIAEYRIPAPSPRTLASPAGQALMKQVVALNPDYDASQFPTRQSMRKAFTSGNQAQQLTALNTAIEHLGVLNDFADALKNGTFTPGNEIYNRVISLFGKNAATNFNFARDIMAGELATAMKKSGATDPEIEKVTGALSSSGSPEQLSGAIKGVAIPMIGGKARVLDEQYHATMGAKDPFSVYTPGAKSVLEKFGAASPSGSSPSGSAPTVGSTVTYQGKAYRVKAIENGHAVLEPQ